MLDRLDLPIRDLLRFLLPGLLAALWVDWAWFLFHDEHIASASNTAAITLVAGLATFAADFHARFPPWREAWNEHLEDLRRALVEITKREGYERERWGKPMYKIWLDAMCQAELRAHLHYTTGLFYVFVALAVVTAGATIAFLGAFIDLLVEVGVHYGTVGWCVFGAIALIAAGTTAVLGAFTGLLVEGFLAAPTTFRTSARLLSWITSGTLVYVFYKRSRSLMDDVIHQGLLAMRLWRSRNALRELGNAAASIVK